ncbi:thioesterase PaaI family protein [Abortiporus biennis]
MSVVSSRLASSSSWVEPSNLPNYGDASKIGGNASDEIKQLVSNVLGAYGVGDSDAFAYDAGRTIKIVEVNVEKNGNKSEATVLAEVEVSRCHLNGAGVMHGGCLCFMIDNCASMPLIALGLLEKRNGVGVSQSLNVLFHSPATPGSSIVIESSAIVLGGRVMSARCEVYHKTTRKPIASALLSKMQPAPSRL